MAQWLRKHMGEIAWVAKRCASVYQLTPTQRATLDQVRGIAHRLSTGARENGRADAERAIALLCTACAEGFPGESPPRCTGRTDWREPCDLIVRMTA